MLTDNQSLVLSGIVLMAFVLFGIIGILDNIFIAALIVIGFLTIVVNLFTTKRVPEAEEKLKQEEETSSKEI